MMSVSISSPLDDFQALYRLNFRISSGSRSPGFLPNIDKQTRIIAGWYTGLGGIEEMLMVIERFGFLGLTDIGGDVDTDRLGLVGPKDMDSCLQILRWVARCLDRSIFSCLKESNLFRLLILFAGLAEAGILEGEQSLAG